MNKVLLIDDDSNILTTLQIHLEDAGMAVLTAATGKKGLETFKQKKPQIVFLDLKLPDIDGLRVLDEIVRTGYKAYVIIITAYATIDTAVKAIKMGAFDYLPKPFTPEQITHHLEMIAKVHGLESQVETLKDQIKGIVREGDFITRSRNVHNILKMARQVADADASVLIRGESGTGKGVLAGLIHAWSPRKSGPFITVDCTGLQENLLESDLFGHVKGAFTGAVREKKGKLELTDGGTVFLDEVSEMSPTIQAKLLHSEDLPPHVVNFASQAQNPDQMTSLAQMEKAHIKNVLLHTASMEEAARVLGIDPATLWRKRKKYQLE